MPEAATKSLCPICLQVIPAQRVEIDNNIYIIKVCPQHGEYQALIWRDAARYESWAEGSAHAQPIGPDARDHPECPYDCGLCSQHEGGTCTAVFHLTDECNLSCPVCFASADGGRNDSRLPLETIRNMYEYHLGIGPAPSIQLSGGEVTLRDDLPEIVKLGKGLGVAHLQVNTNGLRLAAEPEFAYKLKEAGTDLIYLQFDGVSDEVYRTLRGRNLLEVKQNALEHCGEVGLGVLLVPTVVPGVNDRQLGDMIAFAKKWMPVVKGLHFQPVTYFGRFPGQAPSDSDRLTLPELIDKLESQTGGEIPRSAMVPRKRYDSHCAFSSVFLLGRDGRLHPTTNGQEQEPTAQSVESSDRFVAKANEYTNKFWRMAGSGSGEKKKTTGLAQHLLNSTLAITGMHFQDVWSVDLARLKGCCVHVTTPDLRVIPLCAYYMTGADGRRLHRPFRESTWA